MFSLNIFHVYLDCEDTRKFRCCQVLFYPSVPFEPEFLSLKRTFSNEIMVARNVTTVIGSPMMAVVSQVTNVLSKRYSSS